MNPRPEEIRLPGTPAVAGLWFRPFRGPEDYPGMAAANQAARDAAGIEEVITAEGMARDYAHHINCDPATDIIVAALGDDVAGYARVEWRDLENGTRSFTLIAVLEPKAAAAGIYAPMLRWSEDRLAAKARAIVGDPRPGTMRAFSFGEEADLTASLETTGWRRTGQGYEMVRADLDDIPDIPMPDGLHVRPAGFDTASRRAIWDAATEAFADERDEVVPSDEDWLADLADPRQDPALWVVAFDGDDIAGAVQGLIDPDENAHHQRERGLLAAVFTRRPWRRRGLARALMARALVRLRDHGMTSAYLGVDGLNPNQAMDLYTALGFEVASTSFDWQKPLPADAGPPEPRP